LDEAKDVQLVQLFLDAIVQPLEVD
jgi:hypothetical protein